MTRSRVRKAIEPNNNKGGEFNVAEAGKTPHHANTYYLRNRSDSAVSNGTEPNNESVESGDKTDETCSDVGEELEEALSDATSPIKSVSLPQTNNVPAYPDSLGQAELSPYMQEKAWNIFFHANLPRISQEYGITSPGIIFQIEQCQPSGHRLCPHQAPDTQVSNPVGALEDILHYNE